MKRLANILSLLAIVTSASAILWLFRTHPAPAGPAASRIAVNDTRTVHFKSAPDLAGDVDREDQLRDWLLYAVLSQSGLSEQEFTKILYDVPPTRADYMKPVAAFEFGETRYRVVDRRGTIVALIPEGGRSRDQLARIADSARITLGSKPSVVQVYSYSLDPVELTAQVTRKPDIAGDDLFSDRYGYVEREVQNAHDLEALSARIDDVTSVAMVGFGLRVGGRTVTDAKAKRMRTEDIAALWQSEQQLARDRQRIEAFDARWQNEETYRAILEPIYEAERSAILAKYPDNATTTPHWLDPDPGARVNLNDYGLVTPPRNEFQKNLSKLLRQRAAALEGSSGDDSSGSREAALAKLQAKWENDDFKKAIVQKQHDKEQAELKSSLSSKGSAGIPDGSGFSLDPSFDYGQLMKVFDTLQPVLAMSVSEQELSEARRHIQSHEEGPFLDLLYKAEQSKSPLASMAGEMSKSLLSRAQFQHARYDGSLSGTEDGMVLFYTDLLAKLWALDYLERAPEQQVRGFVPLLKVSVAPIYEKELEELSGTRLWFGPRESGYSKTADQLLFAPVATRVYAASRNTLQPGKEAEPNAASARFLGWWNDHYSQVAEFEPQYQRLNQIMKWSVVVGWLSAGKHLDNMGYLSDIGVTRFNWFPVWARANKDLRFKDWDRVQFFERGYQGVDTESMPILRSRAYESNSGFQTLSGGVSLGSHTQIEAKPELKLEMDALERRANLQELPGSVKGSAFKNTDNAEYEFQLPKPGEPAVFEARPASKLRGDASELKKAPFGYAVSREKHGVKVTVGANGHPVGEFSATLRSGSSDIDVLFRPMDVEQSRALANTIGLAEDHGVSPLAALASRDDINRVVQAGESFYIEPRMNRSSWIRLSPEGDPVANLSPNADLRVGVAGGGKDQDGSRWNVMFIDRPTADRELSKVGRYVLEQTNSSARPGVAFAVMGRGPPNEGTTDGMKIIADLGGGRGGEPPHSNGVLAAIDGSGSGRRGNENFASMGGRFFAGDDRGDGAERLAREAAMEPDPNRFVVLIAEQRRLSLRRSDQLISEGKFAEASVELDNLAGAFPRDPEVLMRRAIAHIAGNSKRAGAEAALLEVSPDRVPAFLELADKALPNIESEADRRAMGALVRGTVAKAQGKRVHYVALYNKTDSPDGVELLLANFKTEKASASDVKAEGLRYALQTQDANHPDMRPPMPAVSEPITDKLRDSTVARLQPDTIVDTRTGQKYTRAGGGDEPPRIPNGGNYFRMRYGSSNGCDSATEDDRRKRPECRDEVYIAARSDANKRARR